jgi:hypothetical protein
MEETFWMLYAEGGGAPHFKHGTKQQAEKEAKKLAVNLEKRIYILQAITSIEYINPFKIKKLGDDLPF